MNRDLILMAQGMCWLAIWLLAADGKWAEVAFLAACNALLIRAGREAGK